MASINTVMKIATTCAVVVLLQLFLVTDRVDAKVSCLTDRECETILRPGSSCVDGYCDNPYKRGCLRSQLGEKLWKNGTTDPHNAEELGLCQKVPQNELDFDYPEIRIMSQNWESPFFEAWILQIVLSEMLGLPTTIETGMANKNVNFYDPELRFDYGRAYDFDALERAANDSTIQGDCRIHFQQRQEQQQEDYQGCGHAILELWSGHDDTLHRLMAAQAIEPRSFIGVIGEESWFIPKYTAQADQSLLSHFGLAGEHRRQDLANRFLRPTRWKDFCEEESPVKCIHPGGATWDGNNQTVVAIRPPETEEEGNRFFVEGVYTGYFRKTEENDCEKWPANCTGHFLDYPCGWSSFFIQQAYHLNIALKSSGNEPGAHGYTYSEAVEIFHAANFTKSDLIAWWWRPEALYQKFQGTDFEFQSVLLPHTTQKCIDKRINPDDRCGDHDVLRTGSADGVCAAPAIPNYKLLSTALYKLIHNPDIPDALRSPAYHVLKEFTINSYQLGQIFDYWMEANVDKFGFDPREAVCRWVTENYEDLQRLIPRTYPRKIEPQTEHGASTAAIIFGFLAVVATLLAAFETYRYRNRNVFKCAQIEFVALLLLGLGMVSIAGVLAAFPPTNASCIATSWLLNLGYTFELVPLIVKIAAIYSLTKAAARMKRIKFSRPFLFGVMGAFASVVVMFNVIWTVMDPLKKRGDFALTDHMTENGDQVIVAVAYVCESSSVAWVLVSVGTQSLLLSCSSFLAFLTKKQKMAMDLNEANTISFLIYWNFVCVLLRLMLILLEDSIDASKVNPFLSIILSIDTLSTILIYFFPKFRSPNETTRRQTFVTIDFQRVMRQMVHLDHPELSDCSLPIDSPGHPNNIKFSTRPKIISFSGEVLDTRSKPLESIQEEVSEEFGLEIGEGKVCKEDTDKCNEDSNILGDNTSTTTYGNSETSTTGIIDNVSNTMGGNSETTTARHGKNATSEEAILAKAPAATVDVAVRRKGEGIEGSE